MVNANLDVTGTPVYLQRCDMVGGYNEEKVTIRTAKVKLAFVDLRKLWHMYSVS